MKRVLLILLLAGGALEAAARRLGRRPTRTRIAPGRHLLVYDDDCDFCSIAAIALQLRLGDLELIGFSELPRDGVLESLDRGETEASAHYITPDGVEYHAGEAVTRVLRLVPGAEAARYLDWPVARGLREIGYRLVVWQRGRVSRVLGTR